MKFLRWVWLPFALILAFVAGLFLKRPGAREKWLEHVERIETDRAIQAIRSDADRESKIGAIRRKYAAELRELESEDSELAESLRSDPDRLTGALLAIARRRERKY
jgi:hypothetical protein